MIFETEVIRYCIWTDWFETTKSNQICQIVFGKYLKGHKFFNRLDMSQTFKKIKKKTFINYLNLRERSW